MSSPIPVSLPRSKSIVIRCLIVNYLRNRTLLPISKNDPNDIKVVYNALKIIDSQKSTSVAGDGSIVDVQDCGAAYRFLMAVLAVTPGTWLLTGTIRLLQRPILPLVNFLNANGAKIEKTDSGWRIEGTELQIDNFEIDTSETSQYVSAIMMIKAESRKREKFPLLSEEKVADGGLSPDDGRSANPYIKMTESIIQRRDVARNVSTLSDWSAAVFWIANASLTPNAHYLLKNLHLDGLQGDAAIVPWFQKCGLEFSENENGIEVKHTHHIEISKQKIDVSQTPDIAMILGVLSVCYPFELTMSGLKNLNLKESNRLDILINELSKFTEIEKYSEDLITIYKRIDELPKQFHFDSYNDHRFVMAWSLFKNFGEVRIENSECVRKSYPNF
jgi:3-phosphoshikimate 1-carboxyvinyltransferase